MKRFKTNFKADAFSLMEMMVVLLIVSIIAAASAPMVTRKMARDAAGSGGGPVQLATADDATLPNMSLLINTTRKPQGDNSKLYVNGAANITSNATIGGNTTISGNLLTNNILPRQGNDITLGSANNANSRTTVNGNLLTNIIQPRTDDNITLGNANANSTTTVNGSLITDRILPTTDNAVVSIGNSSNEHYDNVKLKVDTIWPLNENTNNINVGLPSAMHSYFTSKLTVRGTVRVNNITTTTDDPIISRGVEWKGIPPRNKSSNIITIGDENTTVLIPGHIVVQGVTVLGHGGNTLSNPTVIVKGDDGKYHILSRYHADGGATIERCFSWDDKLNNLPSGVAVK